MPVPSLEDLCMKACKKNVANLRDIGSFEYWKIRSVLLRITNPEQLHEIEQASPQIRGEDAELWKRFIARDIPSSKLKRDLKPDDPLKWWELYSECLKEEQRAIERDTEKLREAMMGLKKQKESNVSRVVDSKYLPKQPKDPRMFSNDGGVPISLRDWKREHGVNKKKPVAPDWRAGLKSRLADSASVLTRARREAAVISSRTRTNMSNQPPSTGASRVVRAPTSMIEDYRKAAVSERKIYPARTLEARIGNRGGSTGAQSLQEREKRLRALTSSSFKAKLISEDEDSSVDELDDLFGERASPSDSLPKPSQATRSLPKPMDLPPTPPKEARPTNVISEIFFKGNRKQSSPVKTTIELKPSDIISSTMSKPKPEQLPPVLKAHPSKPSTITGTQSRQYHPAQSALSLEQAVGSSSSRSVSPVSANTAAATSVQEKNPLNRPRMSPPAAMTRKRKPEVDVFNRTGTASKRPRMK